jgi:two-component system, NtrC family, sensor kinase
MFPIGAYSRVFPSSLPLSPLKAVLKRSKDQRSKNQSAWLREMSDRIRRSLQEPVVLQTAVDELSGCLSCDRVVFIQIASKVPPGHLVQGIHAAQSNPPSSQRQTHSTSIEWVVESRLPYGTNPVHLRENDRQPTPGDLYGLTEFGDLAASLQHGEMVVSPAASWRKSWQSGWQWLRGAQTPAPPQFGVLESGAVLLLPIRPKAGVLGFLLCCRERSRAWQSYEVEMALFIAQQLEMALQQARLYQRMHRQAQRERLLNQITSQTRQSLRLEVILSEAISQLLEALGLDRCLVYLMRQPNHPDWEQDTLPLPKTAHGRIAHRRQSLFEVCREPLSPSIDDFDEEGPLTRWVVQYRQRVAISNTSQDDRIESSNREYQRHQIRSALVVPVLSGRRLYAVLYLNQCSHCRNWDPEDQRLAQAVADQLAISIQQASLYSQMEYQAIANAAQSEQLQRAIAELQQTQAQLLQSEKMSSLGRVVAGLAHEINNPVSFVYGNLPYLERYFETLMQQVSHCHQHHSAGDLDLQRWSVETDWNFLQQDVPRVLRSMKTGAERIRQVILSLRNFSRLDESNRKLADIHVSIENTLLMLQHQILDRVTVKRNYGILPLVDCYPGHLNQVFMNLLLNALEAFQLDLDPAKECDRRSPVITLSTEVIHPNPEEKPWVRITIADNGGGIPPEFQTKVFDPFFTTKEIGEGIGLGLSVCYQTIVNQHRGHLWVTSQVGQGSTFTLEIPTCHDLRLLTPKCEV